METEYPSQEQQDHFFRVGLEMWNRAKKIYELVDNYYDGEKEDKDQENGLKELKELSSEIELLKEEKSRLIQKAIGYMYNGVLVGGDISCRKGKVYRFRCQYKLSNVSIKDSIMKNLQEVEKKLTPVNLGIMEALLEMVDEDDDRGNRYSYNARFGSNNSETAELELPNIRLAEFNRDNGVAFRVINKVVINSNGEISFDDKDEQRVNLDSYSKFMLKAKLKDELKKLSSDFLKKQMATRDYLVEEVKTIKSKASNLLMLAEIDNQA